MLFSPEAGSSLLGSLLDTESEHGFRFEPDDPDDLHRRTGSEAWTTFQIGTLQVSVGIESHQALYAWGYPIRSTERLGLSRNFTRTRT
jgi:hypothetical protein